MSAITQVPFYPSDWLAGTRGMTAAQMGVYITLIAMMYERAGPIPGDDIAKLARLCGTSASSMRAILDELISDEKITLADGMLFNRRAELEIAKAIEIARNPRPHIPAFTKAEVLSASRCFYCGADEGPFEIDHIIPVSRGGTSDINNLACSCRTCNRTKGSKLIVEWLS